MTSNLVYENASELDLCENKKAEKSRVYEPLNLFPLMGDTGAFALENHGIQRAFQQKVFEPAASEEGSSENVSVHLGAPELAASSSCHIAPPCAKFQKQEEDDGLEERELQYLQMEADGHITNRKRRNSECRRESEPSTTARWLRAKLTGVSQGSSVNPLGSRAYHAHAFKLPSNLDNAEILSCQSSTSSNGNGTGFITPPAVHHKSTSPYFSVQNSCPNDSPVVETSADDEFPQKKKRRRMTAETKKRSSCSGSGDLAIDKEFNAKETSTQWIAPENQRNINLYSATGTVNVGNIPTSMEFLSMKLMEMRREQHADSAQPIQDLRMFNQWCKSSEFCMSSRFCHICTRCTIENEHVKCSNLKHGICRKIICLRCITESDWKYGFNFATSEVWLCTHCSATCPEKAQCNTYMRVNKRRRIRV